MIPSFNQFVLVEKDKPCKKSGGEPPLWKVIVRNRNVYAKT